MSAPPGRTGPAGRPESARSGTSSREQLQSIRLVRLNGSGPSRVPSGLARRPVATSLVAKMLRPFPPARSRGGPDAKPYAQAGVDSIVWHGLSGQRADTRVRGERTPNVAKLADAVRQAACRDRPHMRDIRRDVPRLSRAVLVSLSLATPTIETDAVRPVPFPRREVGRDIAVVFSCRRLAGSVRASPRLLRQSHEPIKRRKSR
jgi:hypothetical protein